MADDDDDGVVVHPDFATGLKSEAAQVGVAKAAAEAAERQAWALERVAVAQQIIGAYDEFLLKPKDLSKLYKSAAAKVALDVLRGGIEIRHGADAAAIITSLSNAGRLEAGESTQTSLAIASEEQMERMKELRDEANRQLEAAVAAEEASKIVPMPGA